MEESDQNDDLSRIQSFSDGVFAFAVTLLVLSFDVPSGIPSGQIATELPKQIYSQMPTLVSYITSFLVIGGFWYSHHQKFRLIKRYDGTFIFLNLLTLMAVCLLPFTTNLVGEYASSQFAINLYSFSIIITGLSFGLIWWYATANKRLIDKDLSQKSINHGYVISLTTSAIFAISIAFSYIHIDIAKYAWILIGVIPLLFKSHRKA